MFRTANRSITRRWLAPAVALLAVAALAACSGSGAASSTPVRLMTSAAELPLDRYLLDPPELQRIGKAHRALLTRCLGRFGLTIPQDGPPEAMPKTLNERRYGITDPVRAGIVGYHLSADEPTKQPAAPPAKPTAAQAAVLTAALSGEGATTVHGKAVPKGGCFGEARRRLDAGAPSVADNALAQKLSQESFSRSKSDARVVAVAKRWSSCMKARGFEYAEPLDAPADKKFGATITAAEIATAKADVECKRQTNVIGVWFAVESELQRPQIAANAAALEKIRLLNDAELRTAGALPAG